MKKYFQLFAYLFIYQFVFSQASDLPDFGVFTAEEKNLQECSFEKDADAVVLFDYGYSNYDDNYHLITSRRIRIKILNERGISEGNIRIRFYSKGDFEFIRNIQAVSYTPVDGATPVFSYVDRKSIYTEKENEFFSSVKFAIPNVKAGSIIEYKYESFMKHYGGLENWIFQNHLPTLRSCYHLHIIPMAEFQYQVQKKRTYPITIRPMPKEGQIYFEMKNIPGLQFEPYMDAIKDYLQRVDFQFAGYVNAAGSKVNVNTTWREFAIEMSSDKSLGGAVKKDLPKDEKLRALVLLETSDAGKIKTIFNYVKENFVWTGYYSKFATDGLKKAWDKRSGHAAELNLILVYLLQLYNLEAYPLLVADRDYGKVDTTYPYLDRFNKTIVYAVAGGQSFILDASDKLSVPGLTPYQLLNTYAFVVDKKNYKLFRIQSGNASLKNNVTIEASIDEKGVLGGDALITSFNYAQVLRSDKFRQDEKKFIKENIIDENPGLEVDSFYCKHNDNGPFMQSIKFRQDLNENGGFVLLNYNLFTGLQKNPFTKTERFTNVDFGCPFENVVEAKINLPAGAKIDDLLKDKKVETIDRKVSATREIKKEGNTLLIKLTFYQTVTLVVPESYTPLKNIYKDIVEMLNEPIAIKLK